jgi:starvation-inducible DNA-binding protein
MYKDTDVEKFQKEIKPMKTGIVVTSTPSKLATPTDLGDKTREAVSEVINPLVADAFALFVKTKNFHWHMSGSHYRDYHLMLDEQADQIFAMIDILAERVRKLGGTTIRSISQIASLQKIKDDNDLFVEPKEMMRRLMNDNKEYAARMLAAHKVCEDNNDVATASVLEVFIDETERRTWFLFETQAG